MAVYVDDMKAAFGNMLMCHMWADTDEELLHMAERIGVQKKWIQGHPRLSHGKHREASWVHFDIAQTKRVLAVRYGAIQTDRYGPVYHTWGMRGNVERLKQIEEMRLARCCDPKTGQPLI